MTNMKIGTFTTPNKKGQIVIPKEIRDALSINSHVTLNVVRSGNGIYISPVHEFLTDDEFENAYVKLLEKTKGTWKNDDWENTNEKRSNIELNASEKRKHA